MSEKAYQRAQNLEKLRTKRTLHKYKVENVKLATQQEYENFLTKILNKDYKNAENILKIAKLNQNLAQKLQLINNDIFLSKKDLSHFRVDRKAQFKQDLPLEVMKNLPQIIASKNQAFLDLKNKNFFLIHPLNDDELAFLHINKDELGNFIVTAKRADKEDLNKKEYVRVT